MLNKEPELFVISAPSGAGKSTLIRELLNEHENFDLSISATTRPPRAGEVNGVHYHFISDDMFSNLIDENEFVEYAQVHNHRYGTLKSHIKNKFEEGKNVILDIDVQGFCQIQQSGIANTSIFILPPSFSELRERLNRRKSDSKSAIEKRLQNAKKEVAHFKKYDFVIINDDIDNALTALKDVFFLNLAVCRFHCRLSRHLYLVVSYLSFGVSYSRSIVQWLVLLLVVEHALGLCV